MSRRKGYTMGLDKVTLRVHGRFINKGLKTYYFREGKVGVETGVPGINIINHNSYYFINFHDSLFQGFSGSLLEVVKKGLMQLYFNDRPLLKDYPDDYFIYNQCVLAELEVFYDFYNFVPAKKSKSPRWNVSHDTTFYSEDYKVKMRNGKIKEKFHSLICNYNRGRKINSPDRIERIEYRFTKNYIKPFTIADLNQSFEQLYLDKLMKRIIRYTDKYLDPSMIQFNIIEMRRLGSPYLYILSQTKNFGLFTKY